MRGGKRPKRQKGVIKSLNQRRRILSKVKKRQGRHFENAEEEMEAVDEWRESEKERISKEQERENDSERKQELKAQKVAVDMSAIEKKEEIERQAVEQLGREEARAKKALKAKVPVRKDNSNKGKRGKISKSVKKDVVRNYYDPWRSYAGMKKKKPEKGKKKN